MFEETRTLVERRLAVSRELMRLRAAGDTAGIEAQIAKAEGRTAMAAISANFENAVAEQRKELAARAAQSTSTGRFLLAVDVAGIGLILLLTVILMHQTRRSNRELADSLSATRATNESLEAAVAERTEHLVAANEKLRHSSSVMESTFHSMAEAVLVIDTNGEVVLSNPAAERMLRYRPGMNVTKLRALSTAFHADGVTPMTADEMPATRALRGEEFDDIEFIARPRSGNDQSISWSAAGRCATPRARSAARRWSITTSPPRAKPSASCSSRRSWMRSANSPAASRMISTTCSPSSPAPPRRWWRACRTSRRCSRPPP